MRATSILLAALLVFGVTLAMTPGISARPSPVCVDGPGAPCPGLVCADANLDGRFQYPECVEVYCVHGCCGGPCPPPQWD